MFAYFRRHRLTLPIPIVAGAGAGLCAVLAVAAMPGAMLDSLDGASHMPTVIAAAAPPLGATARALLALIGGAGIAAIVMLGSRIAIGKRTLRIGRISDQRERFDLPVLRRADAHPDAPPRPPVMANRDLGVPMMAIPAAPEPERPLPSDLDQPLAAFDPHAMRDVPLDPVRPVAPLVHLERPQLIDPGDRFETFDPTPLAAEIEPTATIHALLDRLERGMKGPVRPTRATGNLDQALGALRRLAS